DLVWVQEESENHGAWSYVRDRLGRLVGDSRPIERAAREEAASPATGSYDMHLKEHSELMAQAFRISQRAAGEETEANVG
ncbi:MAG TPA: hypothetical protein VIV14_00380, partial [Gammaproteobacteria bacterium]